MNEPLTVSEVQTLARRVRGELASVPLTVNADPAIRNAIARAYSTIDELLLLCEFVDDQAAGLIASCSTITELAP